MALSRTDDGQAHRPAAFTASETFDVGVDLGPRLPGLLRRSPFVQRQDRQRNFRTAIEGISD